MTETVEPTTPRDAIGMSETRTVHDPFLKRDVEVSSKLTDRLRGRYAKGPTMPNGEPEFGWSQFETPPIQLEAATALDALQERVKELEATLRQHHDWHLQAGSIGLQDGDGGWIEIDNSAEYSDSAMYERTEKLLAGAPPEELQPMPRGGMNTWWWEQAVLLRRKFRAAESRAIRAEQQRDTLSRVMEDTASELGCASDNEAILEAIDRLKQERDEALERLKPLARDFEMNDCDDRADDDAMEVSIKDLRAASDCVRRLAAGRPDTNPDEG